MPIPSKQSLQDLQRLKEEQWKEERKRDILILVEHLAESEEVTVKMLLDCLYDIGSLNWVDNRFGPRRLNGTMKSIAGISKPVFRMLALRWFKKNAPQLISNWLYSQVKFKPLKIKKKVKQQLSDVPTNPKRELEARNLEVKQLRSQVRLLTGGLAVAIAVLGGTTLWLTYTLTLEQVQPVQQLPKASIRDR